MKIAFLVERPTQFEAPFFRFAARDTRHELRVLFTGTDPNGPDGPAFDPELGRTVAWGIGGRLSYALEAAIFVDLENHDFDLITQLDNARGMHVFVGPIHFGNVNQALDALLDFDKSAVIGQIRNFP